MDAIPDDMTDDVQQEVPGPPRGAESRRLMEALVGIPASEGNRIRVLRNGAEIFPAMLEAIEGSQFTIDLLTYVWWKGDIADRIARALAERARAGVRVRVLLDGFGGRPIDGETAEHMRKAGVDLATVRPFLGGKPWRWNMRTHRRALVCDEEIAFTGGVGIAKEWDGDAGEPGSWRDTHYQVEGPAVDGIRAAFLSDWLEMDRPLLTDADRLPERNPVGTSAVQVLRIASEPGWNDAALAVASLITLARQRIRVTTAYFRSPQHFVDLLCSAVERGVEVEVLVPGPHTEPAHYRWAAEHHYQQLLDRGVRIWCYQPTMLHGKILTVDGEVALVGTTNLDARSFSMNEQLSLVVHDPEVVRVLDEHFDDDLARSVALDPEEWRQRGWQRNAREVVAHVATFGVRGGGASRRSSLSSQLASRFGKQDRPA